MTARAVQQHRPHRGRQARRGWLALATLILAMAVLYRRMSLDDPRRFVTDTPPEPAWLSALARWQPDAPHTRLGQLAAYMWAAPLTVVGLLLGTGGGAELATRDGVVLCTDVKGPLGFVLRRRGFHATTLGHAVLTTWSQPPEALIAHELVHTRQAERFGILFGPIYVALLAKYGYQQHPMERAARQVEGDR